MLRKQALSLTLVATIAFASLNSSAQAEDLNLKQQDPEAILIGLLLPAVQKVREAAAKDGDATREIAIIAQEVRDAADAAAKMDLAAADFEKVLIGLLLPAVQKVEDAGGDMKAELKEDEIIAVLIGLLLPAVQKVEDTQATAADLGLTTKETDEILIGLLLPAVQKVREAAAMVEHDDLTVGQLDEVLIGLLLPAVQKVR